MNQSPTELTEEVTIALPDELEHPSIPETLHHITAVQTALYTIVRLLANRAAVHDASKLQPPELEGWDIAVGTLGQLKYGSQEYKDAMLKLAPTIKHHYEHNRHHPEKFARGINEMTLIDLIEMYCDWYAAGQRTDGGTMEGSLQLNKSRFGISDQLYEILENTRKEFGWV